MDALVAFAQPGLLETEDDRVEVELTREGPPGVPPPRVSHRRHPGLGPRSRARCAQRPRSALVASAGIASGLLNASMQFGGALGLAILSAVATDRTNTVLEHGGTVPLALTAGFQRAFLIGTGLLLVAALIAFTASNTRTGEHTARLEPQLRHEPPAGRMS